MILVHLFSLIGFGKVFFSQQPKIPVNFFSAKIFKAVVLRKAIQCLYEILIDFEILPFNKFVNISEMSQNLGDIIIVDRKVFRIMVTAVFTSEGIELMVFPLDVYIL